MIWITILNFIRKYGIYILAFVLFPVTLYFLYKSYFGKDEPKKKDITDLAFGSDQQSFNVNPKFPDAKITESEAQSIALKVHNALRGFTEDEEKVMTLLLPLNANDFVLVSRAFGLRNLIPLYNYPQHILIGKQELFFWLATYLSTEQMEQFQLDIIKDTKEVKQD